MDDSASIDAQAIAADAAAQALAGQEPRATEDLRWMAEQAAESAAGAVAEQVDATTDADLRTVAETASQETFNLVKGQLQSEGEGETGSTFQVELTADQWSYLHDSMQVQATCSMLSLLLLAMLCGIVLARYVVDGWRR